MTVYKIHSIWYAANSYLVTADGKTAVAIDPAYPSIGKEAEKLGLKIEYVLLTHGHYDHIGGVGVFYRAGAKVGCHKNEVALALGEDNLAAMCSVSIEPFGIDFTFSDGDTLDLCGLKIKVIATPGHTAGSVCFLIEDKLFTGDTLFENGHGRTDFPTGDPSLLQKSLLKLFALPENYVIYTGHRGDSTLEKERGRYRS